MNLIASASLLLSIIFFSYSALAYHAGPEQLPKDYSSPRQHQHHAPKLGAVSSLSAECSKVGIRILKSGGNAADAIIATEFCVGVIGMYATGLGGGGFMLIRAPNGKFENVDFRETAPAASFVDMYKDNEDASLWGGLASGVPGNLRGYEYLHKHYATLPWKKLIEPAISIARNGFIVNQDLVNIFLQLEPSPSFLVNDPCFAKDFARKGRLIRAGERLTRKRYADLLQLIADKGPDAFYTGRVAKTTVAALKAKNGTMTTNDLKNYKITLRKPLTIKYRGYKVTSSSAPSGGPVVLSILKTIEGYKNIGNPAYLNISTHRIDEATRFGFGARTELADPSFFPNISAYQLKMVHKDTAKLIRSKISDDHTLPIASYDPRGIEIVETPGTSHVVAADASGLVISLTSTVNLYFGSRLCVPETGLIMNDEMNDFSIPGVRNKFGFIPSEVNYVAPGKRPVSSMSRTIVEFAHNGKFYYVTGAGGGSHIITAVLQTLSNVLDGDMSVAQALKQPRYHDMLDPNEVAYEFEFNNRTVRFMEGKGHNTTFESRQSEVQAIRRLPNGTFEAASEPLQRFSGGLAV